MTLINVKTLLNVTSVETMPILGVSERKSLVHEPQIMLNLTLHNIPFFMLHNVKVGTFLCSWNIK